MINPAAVTLLVGIFTFCDYGLVLVLDSFVTGYHTKLYAKMN
jgi:hypothetical protein